MNDSEKGFVQSVGISSQYELAIQLVKLEWLDDYLARDIYEIVRDYGNKNIYPRLLERGSQRAGEYIQIIGGEFIGADPWEYAPALEAQFIIRELDKAWKQSKQAGHATEQLFSLRGKLDEIAEGLAGSYSDPYERAIEALTNGGEVIATGIGDLDRVVRMRPGNLIVLAARPGVGKSAGVVTLGRRFVKRGIPVELFEAEMTEEETIARYAAAECGIENMDILSNVDPETKARALSQSEEDRIIATYRELRASGLLIVTDASGMDCEELGHRIATSRAKVCGVDYIQLIKAIEAKGKTREQEVGQISRTLKRAAKRGKKVVIAAAQINRDNKEGRRRPVIADLRESGAIEQDMDVGIFLHLNTNDQSVDSYITEHEAMGNDVLPVEWIVAKNRSGRLKIITMIFDKRYQKFEAKESFRHEPQDLQF